MDMRELLQLAKAGAGDAHMSDRQLARRLGVANTALIPHGSGGGPSDGLALRLAELAAADSAVVLAMVRALRERDPEVKPVLLQIADRLAACRRRELRSAPRDPLGGTDADVISFGQVAPAESALAG